MKILITGTAGFIGFHLAQRLIKRGDEVVGIDNINDYYDINLKPETPVKYAPTFAFHGLPHEIRSKFHQGVNL